MAEPLELRGVVRTYRSDAGALPVLRGVDLCLRAGEIVALVAPSGTAMFAVFARLDLGYLPCVTILVGVTRVEVPHGMYSTNMH